MRLTLRLLTLFPVLVMAGGLPARSQALATGPAALAAYDKTVTAFNQALNIFVIRQLSLARDRRIAKEQLARDKKNALAAMVVDLRDLALRKRNMGAQLRCLGGNNKASSTATGSECWQALLAQHNLVPRALADLDKSIDLVDPNWSARYPAEAAAINNLFWDKLDLADGTLVMSHTSPSGFKNVRVSLADSRPLADALDKEAAALEETSAIIFTVAFDANEGPVDLGPFIANPNVN